jgi:hypothetical protein
MLQQAPNSLPGSLPALALLCVHTLSMCALPLLAHACAEHTVQCATAWQLTHMHATAAHRPDRPDGLARYPCSSCLVIALQPIAVHNSLCCLPNHWRCCMSATTPWCAPRNELERPGTSSLFHAHHMGNVPWLQHAAATGSKGPQ